MDELLDDKINGPMDDKIEALKREIDALWFIVKGKKKPWYRDISALIAIIALLFSFGTTYVSYQHTEAQDIQNMRQELRGLLQRLAALPKENLEISKRYHDDPSAISFAGSLINEENVLLSRQAAQLAKKLPKNTVSSTEYFAIAMAFQAGYNFQGEKEFLELSMANAKTFSDEISAIRTNANLEFISGRPENGRVEYQKALNIFVKYSGYDSFTISSTNLSTELFWAYSEAAIGNLPGADQHVANAESISNTMPPSPNSQMLKSQILQVKAQFHGVGPITNPSGPSQIPVLPPSN